MLPFNALNERNRKQEIGNEASGFYPLSPGQTKETTRRKTMLTSRPKRKVCLHWLPGSVERHSLTAFNLQSKKTTRQQGRTRRLRHTLTSRPIEGQDLTGASPNRRRPAECKSKDFLPGLKYTHFSYFYLLFFFLYIFYAFRYGCNSIGFYLSAFYLLCTNASN